MPEVAGVQHELVRAGEVELHVAHAGDGSPVLLLHGYPQHWYVWRRLIPELARTHWVICPDLRGFGWSEVPRGGYDKETLMWDIVGILDALGIQRVPVAGHDWGGWIGMLMGMLVPERLERVLVMSVPHPWFRASLWTVSVWGGVSGTDC